MRSFLATSGFRIFFVSPPSSLDIAALVARYERPGPRYTSYPSVPVWRDDFDHQAYAQRLGKLAHEAALGQASDLSLYVHLPFCQQRCLYCGCNVVISRKPEITQPYLAALEQEIAMVAERTRPAKRVTQMHWGGGTPTYLAPAELQRLGTHLLAMFDVAPDAERSVEVDPRVTSDEQLWVLRGLGFDRLSMGVQDLDPQVQAAIGRVQPEPDTQAFFARSRAAGFTSINVDLIYGLPQQTPHSFANTINSVISWAPDRVALFGYAHVPHLRPHQARMPVHTLPEAASKLALYVDAVERFEAAGYLWIGLDHFAKPGDDLARAHAQGSLRRNFMGFTTKPETQVLAFGMSAISEVDFAYAQNDAHLPSYRKRIEAGHLATTRGVALSADDRLRRDVIMSLLCTGRVHAHSVGQRHNINFHEHFAPERAALAPLVDDGLLTLTADGICVTRRGRWVLRNICMAFDAHLAPPAPSENPAAGPPKTRGAPRFSSTI